MVHMEVKLYLAKDKREGAKALAYAEVIFTLQFPTADGGDVQGQLKVKDFSIIKGTDGQDAWVGFPKRWNEKEGQYFPVVWGDDVAKRSVSKAILREYQRKLEGGPRD